MPFSINCSELSGVDNMSGRGNFEHQNFENLLIENHSRLNKALSISISADFLFCFSRAKLAIASASTVLAVVPTSVVAFALFNIFQHF